MTTVLLVDDDPQMTRITRRVVTKAGFKVHVSNRAFGVLNLIAEMMPDIVVLDMNMPGLSGRDLLELVRKDPDLNRTRVVFFSGIQAWKLEAIAERSGADGWVHKTDGAVELVEVLQQLAVRPAKRPA